MNITMDIFNKQVTKSGDTISMTYCHNEYSGHCTYKETILQGTNKRFKQRVLILVDTQMDDIIECMYKMGEITGSQDLQTVSMMIQTDSRKEAEMFIDPHSSSI